MNCFKYTLTSLLMGMVLSASSLDLYSQRCPEFNQVGKCKIRNSTDYRQYGQARSAVLEVFKPYSYNMIFYGRKDYKVKVCAQTEYYPIHFRLINPETDEVFYDNATDNYIESVGFIIDDNTPMIIEVTLMAEGQKFEDGRDMRSCVGIQILWRKTPRLGF